MCRTKQRPEAAEGGPTVPTAECTTTGGMTEDQYTQQEEELEGETWSRGRSASAKEKDVGLANTLKAILKDAESVATDNKRKHKVLKTFFEEEMPPPGNAAFMSYPTFNKFMNGTHEAKKGIGSKQSQLIQAFIDKKRSTPAPAVVVAESANTTAKAV